MSAMIDIGHVSGKRDDCFALNYRLYERVFNLVRLRTRTKISTTTFYDLQYADAAVLRVSQDELQRSLPVAADTYGRAGLIISTSKMKVLSRLERGGEGAGLHIGETQLSDVDRCRHLGSVLTDKCNLTDEIYRSIDLAAAAFGKLQSRVFSDNNLRLQTKVKVYKAICLSILLYASETWVHYRRHVKLLQSFYMRTLRKILGIDGGTW